MKKLKTGLLILSFLGLYLSSFLVVFFALKSVDSFLVFISFFTLTLVIYFFSRFIRKRRPEKFLQSEDSTEFIYGIMSAALSIFLLSFVFESFKFQWNEFHTNSNILVDITSEVTGPFLLFLIPFIPLYLIWRYYSRHHGFLINFVIASVVFFSALFMMFNLPDLIESLSDLSANYLELAVNEVFIPGLFFIAGILPLGWFYELFIETVLPKEHRQKSTGLLRNFTKDSI